MKPRLSRFLERERYPRLVHHAGPVFFLVVLQLFVFYRCFFKDANGLLPAMTPYDFSDTYSRFLVYISDCLRGGAWPTWYPYGQGGMPFYIYPQSQLWNPVTWLVSLTTGYTMVAVQRQLVLTFILGSLGLYALAYALLKHRTAAWIGAIAYACTSARLCNAEHLDIVNAYALYPWIFLGLLQAARGKRGATPVLGALLGLFLVSAYLGVIMLSPVWLGAWVAFLFFEPEMDRAARRRFAKTLGGAGLLALVVASGFLLTLLVHAQDFSRRDAFSVDAALASSLGYADLTHLLFGISTLYAPFGAGADISMRGLFFGILPLALAILGFTSGKNRWSIFLGCLFLAGLLLSLGKLFPPRVAVHEAIPFFNYSRFPSADSRPVGILFACLLAAFGVNRLSEDPELLPRFRRLLLLLSGVLVAGWIWGPALLFSEADRPAVTQQFSVAMTLSLLAIAACLMALTRAKETRWVLATLAVTVGLEVSLHTPLDSFLFANGNAGATAAAFPAQHHDEFLPTLALLPRVDTGDHENVGSCLSFVSKEFTVVPCGPFFRRRYDLLVQQEFRPFLREGKRVVAFSDLKVPLKGQEFRARAEAVQFTLPEYRPNRVTYHVTLPRRQALVFNELYFDGWVARIDDQPPVPMQEFANGLRGLVVDAGPHRIQTWFSPWSFYVGLATTLLGWILILAWYLRARRAPKHAPAELLIPGEASPT